MVKKYRKTWRRRRKINTFNLYSARALIKACSQVVISSIFTRPFSFHSEIPSLTLNFMKRAPSFRKWPRGLEKLHQFQMSNFVSKFWNFFTELSTMDPHSIVSSTVETMEKIFLTIQTPGLGLNSKPHNTRGMANSAQLAATRGVNSVISVSVCARA